MKDLVLGAGVIGTTCADVAGHFEFKTTTAA
jgi:hypothetical protein